MNLTIYFISEDLVIECVAASYVLPPGDNDMYDDMPELEDYVDVVADLLMVNLPQNRGLLWISVAKRCLLLILVEKRDA